jgi:hypothetical protein
MNKNLLYIAGAAFLFLLLSKKKVSGAQGAASKARKIVSNAVDQTTFVPDQTTFADQYKQDKKTCR